MTMKNFVLETSVNTIGTGSYSLLGSPVSNPEYTSILGAMGAGAQCFYTARGQTSGKWEANFGVVNTGVPNPTLSRNNPCIESWNGTSRSTSLINWGAGDGTLLVHVCMLGQVANGVLTTHRGSSPPIYILPGMLWIDTSGGSTAVQFKIRTGAGTWVSIGTLNESSGAFAAAGNYLPLSGGTISGNLTVTGTVQVNTNLNVQGISNLQGLYTAVYGDLSVCGNGGSFPPSFQLQVADFGMTTASVSARDANQARLQIGNSNRAFIYYVDGGGSFTSVYDLTGALEIQRWNAGGGSSIPSWLTIGGDLHVGGNVRAKNDLSFKLDGGGSDRYLMFDSNCYIQRLFSDNTVRFVKDGVIRWLMNSDGSLRVNGVHDVFDGSGHLNMRVYTMGTRPSAASFPARIIAVSDYFDGVSNIMMGMYGDTGGQWRMFTGTIV